MQEAPLGALIRTLSFAAAIASTALAAAGCGGGDADAQPANNVPTDPGTIQRSEVQRQVGTAFADGLGRLAVMNQPRDDAADLGQDLPTGLLRGVVCPSATSCTVRWQTVDGERRSTGYRIRAFQGACLTAAAEPRLPDTWDASIKTTAENPLNSLVGTGEGCP